MKKRMVCLVFAVGMVAALAVAQDTMKKDAAPKPAVGPSQALLDAWNDVGRKLIAMAEDFPTAFYKSQLAAGQVLPESGSVFISVKDGDKPVAVAIAKTLHALGYAIMATRGTAAAIAAAPLPAA